MSIYVEKRRSAKKSSIKINSTPVDYVQSYPVQSSPAQNGSFQDYPVQSSPIQGTSLSFHPTLPENSPVSLFSGQYSGLKVFLDMDGVLTDFTGACERLSEHMMFWYTADKERFWKHITAAGARFWSDMPWMAGGKELHGFLNSSGLHPTILSALPTPDRKIALVNARKGKIEWLKKELGTPYANNAILCFRPEKALQSGTSRVLIDDNSDNIREWEEAGGTAILHKSTDRTIRCLSKTIKLEQRF
ncbi:hypothetical protein [Methanosarcina sp. 1.H.A.2.2]|uniref:5' nucleotidase, NT5C type n=1 Tax=Methanosarcina sp. 1.H.A.2.2 TaxID=1483601 RepID=UPI0006225060|nr:hypothetical protein [Methanosarcina sp. 1.H.A.2.2]KKH47698.1 hypothetical protein EO93_13145 [Methanosarcina sp. 1.H.A.2.2]